VPKRCANLAQPAAIEYPINTERVRVIEQAESFCHPESLFGFTDCCRCICTCRLNVMFPAHVVLSDNHSVTERETHSA
jgi:hypothetical protein